MIDVIGIGAAVFDILMTSDKFPKEDTKIQGNVTKLQCGGPCATALVAISKLGVSSGYIGTVGDDLYGKYIIEGLQKYNVNTDRIRCVQGAQSFHSFVLLNTMAASRTCIWNKGTVPSPDPSDVDLGLLTQAKYLHLDGNQLECSIYAAEKARVYGVPVSLDAGAVYPGIERLLPLIDILIPSEEFSLKITNAPTVEEAAAILQEKYNPGVLIVTQGANGGFWWRNGTAVHYPSFQVAAVDSNGAGDTFHGAFLAARVKGLGIYEAATFASAAAAIKCTRMGAQDGIPFFPEVSDYISSRISTSG